MISCLREVKMPRISHFKDLFLCQSINQPVLCNFKFFFEFSDSIPRFLISFPIPSSQIFSFTFLNSSNTPQRSDFLSESPHFSLGLNPPLPFLISRSEEH